MPANHIRSRAIMTQLASLNVAYQERENYVFLKIGAFLFVALFSDHLASAFGSEQTCTDFRY
jgi:hypothetical protein